MTRVSAGSWVPSTQLDAVASRDDGDGGGDDDALLLPFVEALYDASFAVEGNDDNDDDAGAFESSEGSDVLKLKTRESPLPPSVDFVDAPNASAELGLAKPRRTAKKPSVRWNPNKARDERKGELIYLRKKVVELEAELGRVQAKRPRLASSAAAAADEGVSADAVTERSGAARTSQAITSVWKEIASRQSEERVKAECENVRLKIVLENQLKIAKSLEKVLTKKATAKDIEEFVERNKLCAPTADVTDADVFKALLSEVELMFSRVDSVFETNKLAHAETSVTSARVRSDAHSGVSLEIFANKLLPFELHATGDAAWHYFTSAKVKAPYRCYQYSSDKHMHTSDNMVVENFILKLKAKGTDANLRCKQVIRRRVEEERVVIVWRSAAEPFEFSDEPVSGVRFYQDGYIVIKRPSTIQAAHTLLQSCYIFTPDFAGDFANRSHPRVGAITDFMLASTAAYIASAHQMIENVLIDQARKSSNMRVQTVH